MCVMGNSRKGLGPPFWGETLFEGEQEKKKEVGCAIVDSSGGLRKVDRENSYSASVDGIWQGLKATMPRASQEGDGRKEKSDRCWGK